MKIQVIFTSSYPIGQVSTNRVHHLCRGLVECGADLELLIAQPTETPGMVHNHKAGGVYENVRFCYTGNRLLRNRNLVVRKITDFYFHLITIKQLLLNPEHVDIFIVIGAAVDFRLLLPLAAHLGKAKIVLEINEYPYAAKDSSRLTRIKRFILLKGIFPAFDGFIVISGSLYGLVEQYRSEKATSIVIPVLCDCPGVKNTSQSPLSVPYIIHTGSILENKDGIIGILQAFKIAIGSLEQPIKFVITGNVGNSKEYRRVADFISENCLSDRVIFTGHLSKENLERYLRNSSLAIINKYNNLQNRYCFPTKLCDYLMYEVPLIVTSVGESSIFLKDGLNAHIVEPEDTGALASKIIWAIQNAAESKYMAHQARSLVEKDFNYFYQGQRLTNFLNVIL